MRSTVAHQHSSQSQGMEPARVGYHRIVADILRRAPAEDAARIAWQLVAGAKVAERTSVVGFQERVLFVRVPDLAWRTELLEFTGQYLAALNGLLPTGVAKIEFLADEKKTPNRA